MLVHEKIIDEFTTRFVERAAEYVAGDPADPETRVGTVIDEPAAIRLEKVVQDAVAGGAKVLLGGNRRGAQLPPTVVADVPRDAEMVVCESFGPLAPIMSIRDIDVPGSRIDCSTVGGVKDCSLGIKGGVIEAIKCMTVVKTFSLPF